MSKLTNPMAILVLSKICDEKIDKKVLESFFSDPPSCLIIYRLLPEISKNLLIRVINLNEGGKFQYSEMENYDFFINTSKSNSIQDYISGLTKLKILEKLEKSKSESEAYYKINEQFYKTMKKILSEGLEIDKKKFHRKSKGYEKYLEKGVNKFYKFINDKIFGQFGKYVDDSDINNFLLERNFLSKDSENKYQMGSLNSFLYKTEDFIISFFYNYLEYNIEKNILNENKFEFLHLLLYLATLEPGSYFTEFPAYYDSSFDKYLEFMNQIGFLIIKSENKNSKVIKKYFCTPLIQSLFENNNISEDYNLCMYGDENAHRFLYVETNMKFYAFMPDAKKIKIERQTPMNLSMSESISSSFNEKEVKDEKINFYINLLKWMFKIEMILPENGLIGYITRENLKKIFKKSSSERLLQFLSYHMSLNYDDVTVINNQKYLINESVVNQILVLESEKKSVDMKSVVCFYDFWRPEQYKNYLNIIKKDKIKIIKAQENSIIVISSSEYTTKELKKKLDNH